VIVVVKIGTSSLTNVDGSIKREAIAKLCYEVAEVREKYSDIILVSSGAIGVGLPMLGYTSGRPDDSRVLQAASAIGQPKLMAIYGEELARHNLVYGQLLLAPDDFFVRSRYLHARSTLESLLEAGIVPIVNENDAVADDAIRWGDNDRIAALLAHLVQAEKLIILTDTEGIFSADPHLDKSATLISEIDSTAELTADVGKSGGKQGSGGMSSKLAAARMAAWSGVTTTIASAASDRVLINALNESPEIGTIVRPNQQKLSAKKLWIAFALEPNGTLQVDHGAEEALLKNGGSLLAVGVKNISGQWKIGESVSIINNTGKHIARGLCAISSTDLSPLLGLPSKNHPKGLPEEVIHRDDLVLLSPSKN
jgi:glutamate 5-kinase